MKSKHKISRPDWRVIFVALLFCLQTLNAQISFNVDHGFAGGASDGSHPEYDSSLAISGASLYGVTQLGGQSNSGTLFVTGTNLASVNVLHSFNGYSVITPNGTTNDGAYPYGTPVVSGNTVYGVTGFGGTNGLGTVYSIGTSGSGFKILHHFGGLNNSDGYWPHSSLILSGSTLYGMTSNGTNGDTFGTIFSINTDGSNYHVLYTFGPGGDPQGALTLSGSTLYGMTYDGGSNSQGNIFQINTDGSGFQDLHSFTGVTNDGSFPIGSLTLSGSTLYGTTSEGGISNVGTIFAINTDGGGFTIMHNFTFQEGWQPVGGLTLSRSGLVLYGMTQDGGSGGTGQGAVFAIAVDGGDYQILHTFSFPSPLTDGSMPWGKLLLVNSELYGMTSSGGSDNDGIIFGLPDSANTTPPTCIITSPTAGQQVTTYPTYVFGTASSTPGIYEVRTELNNGPWLTAFSGNGYATWESVAVVTPGTNIIHAFAMDLSGNLSPTGSVTFVYVVKSVLTVITNGGGTIASSLNGQTLQEGLIFTMTAKADKGSVFVNWTDGHGNVLTNGTTLNFTMTANLTLVANFRDDVAPTMAITSPKTGAKSSNDVFTVTGTASDNVTVSNVLYSLNGGALTNASLASTTWSAQIILVPGTNTFTAYAVDGGGNHSKTNSIKVIYIVSAQIAVNIIGQGTLKPNYNGAFLAISNHYTMVATPAKGSGFYYWNVGAGMSNSPTLDFTMVTNLMITAHFKDITPPTVTITAPKANAKESNTTVTVSGTASDNVGVETVYAQNNGTGWVSATGTASWNVSLPVASGLNTVQVFAVDAAGNASKTNPLTFTGTLPPDWAPVSLDGSTVLVTPAAGNPISVSFGATTFGQADILVTNDTGIGAYAYSRTATNMAELSLTNSLPLTFSNSTAANIQFDFTGLNTGVFTNEDEASINGTFSIITATNFLPTSWSSHTITASHPGNSNQTTVKFNSTTTVTVTSPSNPSRTGTYLVTEISPVGAMIVVTYTDTADLGNASYLQVTFDAKTGGHYEVNTFNSLGEQAEEADFGTFTFK